MAVFVFIGFGTNSDIDSRMVDFGLEDIGELVTQVGHYTSVQVDKEARDLWGLTLSFTQSKYIYSYDGEVKASIDFAAITIDIDDEAKKISIHIPEEVKLDVYVDPTSMEIYDESKNIFTPLSLDRTNSALREMEAEVREKALANGIDIAAIDNAKTLIKTLVSSTFNTTEYAFVFK